MIGTTVLFPTIVRDAFIGDAVASFRRVHGAHPDLAFQVDYYHPRRLPDDDTPAVTVLVVTGAADRISALDAFLRAITHPDDAEAIPCDESPF